MNCGVKMVDRVPRQRRLTLLGMHFISEVQDDVTDACRMSLGVRCGAESGPDALVGQPCFFPSVNVSLRCFGDSGFQLRWNRCG